MQVYYLFKEAIRQAPNNLKHKRKFSEMLKF